MTDARASHPFDTIKVRLQTSTHDQFKGPVDALMQTLRKEGINGIYKGATPPLIGWMCMDSLMLGSLTLYRRLLNEHVFRPYFVKQARLSQRSVDLGQSKLPAFGHGIAGMAAGWTVSFVAAPVEHIKARLQVQYQADKSKRQYAGPIDCAKKIYGGHGEHRGVSRIRKRADRVFPLDRSARAISRLAGDDDLSHVVLLLVVYVSILVRVQVPRVASADECSGYTSASFILAQKRTSADLVQL